MKVGDTLVGKYSRKVKLVVLAVEQKEGVTKVKVQNPLHPKNVGYSSLEALEAAFEVERKN